MLSDARIQFLDEPCAAPHVIPMTVEKFDAWVEEAMRAEFNGGNAFIKAPVSVIHSNIWLFLNCFIGRIVENGEAGYAMGPRFQMRLPESRFEPDFMFVKRSNVQRITEWFLDGPADMVIEIVSPESAARDWHDKFLEYEAGGVHEYWLIDHAGRRCDCYRLMEKKYQNVPMIDGRIRSTQLEGFELCPEWFWSDPLPSAFDLLREIGQL